MDNHLTETQLNVRLKKIKYSLPSEDVLVFSFSSMDEVDCALIYADGMVNKQLLGELVARPISAVRLENEGGRVAMN